MGHQDKDSGILCIGHGQNSLFGLTMATLILLHRKIWLSWANWPGKKGNTIFQSFPWGREGHRSPNTKESPPLPSTHFHPSYSRSICDMISYLKTGLTGKIMHIFLHTSSEKEVLLPSLDGCYLSMLIWRLNNLPCCSSTISPCLQSAKSETG